MKRKEHLLLILMEECQEVAHRASKALRFSLEESEPEQMLNNAERIDTEIVDLLAVVEMLRDENLIPRLPEQEERKFIQKKKNKVEKFLLHSKECGTLEDE